MSLTDCCSTGFKHEGTPDGTISTIGGLETYSVGAECGWEKIVVIFTDIFGHKFLNNQLLADQLSKSGKFQVLIPDILEGDPIADFGSFDAKTWIPKHNHDRIKGIVDPFLKQIVEKEQPKAIYGIAHCFGAPQVFRQLTKDGYLTRGAVAHPSMVTKEDLEKVEKPLLISTGPDDAAFGRELRNQTIDILTEKDVIFQMDIFSGADHGYQVRGDITVPRIKYAKEKTTYDQVAFFSRL